MSLINYFEIVPPKHDKLSNYLYTELKNQCAWRDNKSDSIQDQYRFFDSYFGKNFKNNYINKELIYDYLKESEKAHHLQLNSKIINKSKFLELDSVRNTEEDFYLYYYDSDDKNFNLINFNFENEEKKLYVNDIEEFSLNFDTNLRQISIPQSNYFKPQTNNVNRSLLMDMYSIYSMDFEKVDDDTKIRKFDKLITLEEIPNSFMSGTLINKFFIVSYSNSANFNNRITIIDDNFRISAYKDLNTTESSIKDYKSRVYKKGEFVNHPMIVLLYKDIGEIIITDFRSKENYEKKILDDNKTVISSAKMFDGFKYILFSTKKIELFDLRYPSLKVSEFPLNINYKGIELKNAFNLDEFDTDSYYIGIDQSRKDCSHLLFKTVDDNRLEFFNDFIDVTLIRQSKESLELHDSIGLLVNKDNYMNFTVDNFGALNGFIYNIKNSNDCTKNNFELIKNNFMTQIDGTECKTVDDKITEIFDENFKNNIFKKNKIKKDFTKYNKIKCEEGDEEKDGMNDSEILKSDESESEEEMNFGKSKINGNKQKLYKLQNKRKLVEDIIKIITNNHNTSNSNKNGEDYLNLMAKLNMNEEVDEGLNNKSDIAEELKWLFDKFDEEMKK